MKKIAKVIEFAEGINNTYNCKNCPCNEINGRIIEIKGRGSILPCQQKKCICVGN